MGVPISQMWTVATYVLKQKVRGNKHYPLVLMLEPLLRCNLACAGCGKIQYPAHILKRQLTPDECFKAVEECGCRKLPIPSIPPALPRVISRALNWNAFFPTYLCNYFKYPVILDGQLFRDTFGWTPKRSLNDIFSYYRRSKAGTDTVAVE